MKLDLHIHSAYSRDGSASPKEILQKCRELGLGGLAIADHNQINGALEASRLAGEFNLVVVRAVEVSTDSGHVLAYGIDETVSKGLSIEETIDRIHSLGGIAVAAHPRRFPSGVGLDIAGTAKFDAIEVLNGGNSARSNALARKLAERLDRPMTAGSDAHRIDEVGKSYIEIENAPDEGAVLDAIASGRARVCGRSRSHREGAVYSMETLVEWLRGSFRRL